MCGSAKLTFIISISIQISIEVAAVTLSKHPVVVLISYDGFRHDYLTKTKTPNLHRIKYSGVSVPFMQNQFKTQTFPNHQSIATGLYIESHGIVENLIYDPLYGRVLNGKLDEPGFWNYSSSVVPLWIANELAGDGRVSGVSFWPGSAAQVGPNGTRATYIRPFQRNVSFELRMDEIISWVTDPVKPANLIFAYFEEPDAVGHRFGPRSPKMLEQIARMDNLTGYFLNKLESLGILNKINLIFLSDHGMSDVSDTRVIDIRTVVDAETYFQYGANPVIQILPKNESQTYRIYEAFKAFSWNHTHFDVYLKQDINTLEPHWHYSDTRRILPILLVANPGWQFAIGKPSNGGLHGYDNKYHDMHPYFMAQGPAFRVNRTEKTFENIDVYPLICFILNIQPPPINGSFERVRNLLKSTHHGSSSSSSAVNGIHVAIAIIGSIAGLLVITAVVFTVVRKLKRRSQVINLQVPDKSQY